MTLDYSFDSGKTWKNITKNSIGLKYKWNNIPLPQSNQCLARVRQLAKSATSNDTVNTLRLHTNAVWSVAFSPDGKILASGSDDTNSKLWDVSSGKEIQNLIGHNQGVYGVAFSPDGNSLATGGFDKIIKLWDVSSGQEIRTLTGHTSIVSSVAFSPDGSTLASSCYDNTIKLWDVSSGQEIRTLIGHTSKVYSVAFSPDGKILASGSNDRNIKLWNPKTGQEIRTLTGHTDLVRSVAFSPDGSLLASGGYNSTIKLWNPKTGQEIRTLTGHTDNVLSVVFSPDGSMLASGSSDRSIKLWNIITGEVIQNLTGHTDLILSVAFSPDGSTLASASSDMSIKLWELDVLLIQEGVSDAVFSINAPEPQFKQLNIDIGQVIVGSSKDTMVTAVLCNVGQAPLHVLGVDVTNGNTNEFMVPRGAGDFFLPPNECQDMMFAFMPSQVGVRSAKITVKSTLGDYIDTINISGTGILPSVKIVNKFIDFGYINVGFAKDTLQAITIKNISNLDIDLKNTYHSGPNDKDFTTNKGGGAFKLKANETAKLDMRFLPTSVGRTSGTLMFEYDGIGSPAVVQLFGAGIGGVASLKLDSIEANTSTIVEYPIKLTISGDIIKSGANAVNFDITYNHTLLYSLETYPITNKDGNATLSFKNVPLTADPIQILQTLLFKTGLCNAIETPLSITNFELLGTTEEIDVTLNDGNLKLTDLCYDGGVRLLNPNLVISMANISPNPVNSIIKIDLNLIEIGNTEVSIYNLLGEKVKTIFSKDITEIGSISINSDLSDLSNGQYIVIFKTPTYLEKNNILLIK